MTHTTHTASGVRRRIIIPTTLDSTSREKILEIQRVLLNNLLMKAAVEPLNKVDLEQFKTCIVIERELNSAAPDANAPADASPLDDLSTEDLLRIVSK